MNLGCSPPRARAVISGWVPVSARFFVAVQAYLEAEKPPSRRTGAVFVVLKGQARGQPRTPGLGTGVLVTREEPCLTAVALVWPMVGSVLSAGQQVGVLPSHGLDVLGRGLEQLVGQVSQGPGDPRQGSDTTAPNGLGNPVIAEWRSGGTSRRRNLEGNDNR